MSTTLEDRSSESIEESNGDATNKKAKVDLLPLDAFIESNYELLAIIGIFGGVSVYLTQLPIELATKTQGGIAGSLILFVLTTLTVAWKAVQQGLRAIEEGDLLAFVYAIVAVCLLALVWSIWSILNSFSEGIVPALDIAVTVALCALYITSIPSDETFTGFEGHTEVEKVVRNAPKLAAGCVFLSLLITETGQNPLYINTGENTTYIEPAITLILTHLLVTVTILGAGSVVDDVIHRISRYREKDEKWTRPDKVRQYFADNLDAKELEGDEE